MKFQTDSGIFLYFQNTVEVNSLIANCQTNKKKKMTKFCLQNKVIFNKMPKLSFVSPNETMNMVTKQ